VLSMITGKGAWITPDKAPDEYAPQVVRRQDDSRKWEVLGLPLISFQSSSEKHRCNAKTHGRYLVSLL
jgi:hypothetical protein